MNIYKNRAIKLRLQGKTYSDINRELGVKISKSTLSEWLKKLTLTSSGKKKLEMNIQKKLIKSRTKAWKTNKLKRLRYLKSLKDKNLHLLKRIDVPIQKIILSTLYLAEGSKNKNTAFLCLGNSNPKIIQFYLLMLRNCFELTESKFRVRIQCRADQNKKKLEDFWQKITAINSKKFYPTYADKRSADKKTLESDYKGVCVIHYFDTSIQLELELLGSSMIEYLSAGR